MPVEVTRRRREGARGGDARKVRRAIEVALEAEGAGARMVSLLLTDDREIHALNAQWRGKDKPTDVLAFALDEADGPATTRASRSPRIGPLGDVIISVERARAQAKSRRVTLDAELELLAVHGTLHLLGYDHAEPGEARLMRARTRSIRKRSAQRAQRAKGGRTDSLRR